MRRINPQGYRIGKGRVETGAHDTPSTHGGRNMTELSRHETLSLLRNREGFHLFCKRFGPMPDPGTEAYTKLARAFLSWSTIREREYGNE